MDVPECLSSHLTTCHYKTLLGKNFEMEIVRKILKAARVLKTMNITVESHLSSKAKLRICQKLMKFRRSSKTFVKLHLSKDISVFSLSLIGQKQ